MFMEKTTTVIGVITDLTTHKEYKNEETGKVSEQHVKLYFLYKKNDNSRPEVFPVKVKNVKDIEDKSVLSLLGKSVKIDNINEVSIGGNIYYSCDIEDVKVSK